jgi:hypothetical protein
MAWTALRSTGPGPGGTTQYRVDRGTTRILSAAAPSPKAWTFHVRKPSGEVIEALTLPGGEAEIPGAEQECI